VKNLAAIVSLLALLATPQFLAGAPDTVFLEDLTWPELRALIDTGRVTTIILPIGGTEQATPTWRSASITCGALAGSGVLGGLGIGKTQTVLSDRLKPPAQPRQTPDAITKIRQGLAGSFAFTFGTVSAFFGLGMLAVGFAGLASEDKGANGLGLFLVFLPRREAERGAVLSYPRSSITLFHQSSLSSGST
jgi:hypothetical protein